MTRGGTHVLLWTDSTAAYLDAINAAGLGMLPIGSVGNIAIIATEAVATASA